MQWFLCKCLSFKWLPLPIQIAFKASAKNAFLKKVFSLIKRVAIIGLNKPLVCVNITENFNWIILCFILDSMLTSTVTLLNATEFSKGAWYIKCSLVNTTIACSSNVADGTSFEARTSILPLHSKFYNFYSISGAYDQVFPTVFQ